MIMTKTHQQFITEANQAMTDPAMAVKDDRFRLRYHLMPPVGWMNDPNGLIHYQGEYHVFYQHYPFAPKQGPMYWGHAKSKDLVHWEHLPVALAPSEAYDFVTEGTGGGCWSGSAAQQDGKLVLIYTGHVDGRSPEEVQCLALSEDGGISFAKLAENPVIPGPPEKDVFGFRDPKVWKGAGLWNMVVGSGKDGKGKAQFYQSYDLREWRHVGEALESDGTMGDMWECPDLFPLGGGDRHVLIVSPMNMGDTKTMYVSGNFDYQTGKLTAGYQERLDYGFDFYAPQTFADDRGRRILFAWMNMWGTAMPEKEDHWMGAFTVPRELILEDDGTLRMVPVSELTALRGARYAAEGTVIEADAMVTVDELRGDTTEIIAVFDLGASEGEEFGIRLRCSSDDRQYTEVCYSAAEKGLRVDREHAGIGDGGISRVQFEPAADGLLKLHLFVDRSSVELFANDGRISITNRIYPDAGSLDLKLFSRKGLAVLQSLEAWRLK
jgi:beta-fructofuranosidase